MLNVLLADDEAKVIRHLQTAIPWKQLGLQVSATAQDGIAALHAARGTAIDIVITDIRMPGMDGLALCQKMRELNPDIQFIILSGYQDFSYAKRAIDLQVLGYCLKPIDISDLTALLRTAVRNAMHRRTDSDELLDLIEGGNPDEITTAFSELGIYNHEIYAAASFGVHNIEKPLGAQISYKLGKHKYLYFSEQPFDTAAAQKIIAYAGNRGGVGIPQDSAPPENLRNAVEDALAMAFQFFVNGRATLCSALQDTALTHDAFTRLDAAAQQPMKLKVFLEELSHADCSLIFNIRTAFVFCNRVAASPAFGSADCQGERMLYGFEQLPADYGSLSELLHSFSNEIISTAIPLKPASASGSFLPILRYLEENYEKDLSLKKIADQFHLNASYISQLIRSETGLTYTQYLTELRINKAKELLRTSSLSLAEISEAVGFNDSFYFIKKFKKEVGVTPGKYVP